tara:strand:- start:2435 stop:2674 length:240 start_codon:yes stop_codon:yes gene_type:complete
MMEWHSYIFLGVGVAISVLGFFLKKEAQKQAELDSRVKDLEIMMVKNSALDGERWIQTGKLLEDRRADIIKIYDVIQRK